ncbi:MAG: aspartate kinase [Oligoflexia bacterium]|nr:aspartate kinase [Oligoflexia bacterium]
MEREALIVAKFGGTSVGSREAILQLRSIVEKSPKLRVIVVSATSGTTNELCALAENPHELSILERVIDRHLKLANELKLVVIDQHGHRSKLYTLFDEMRAYCFAAQVEKINFLLFRDHLLSFGEALSVALLSEYLQAAVVDARELIITDDNFGEATPLEVKSEVLREALLYSQLVITAGFIGGTRAGTTTTLGRGGSDYSAALIARALNADCLQIWTDVSGVYTCDPRSVPNAKSIPRMNQTVAAELAFWGAKVLHPATLLPIFNSNTKVWVGNTFAPEEAGTWIDSGTAVGDSAVQAITFRPSQTIVTLIRVKKHNTYGFLARVFALLTKHKISVDHVTTSEISTSFTVYEPAMLTASPILEELSELAEVKLENNFALISLVGQNIIDRPHALEETWKLLNGHSVRSLYMGASKNNISFLIAESIAHTIVKKLHAHFLELH